MIPVFTIFFVIVILITVATIKHNTKEQDSVDSRFWERELKANSTLKKDISNLKYITIPDEFFPSESDALISKEAENFLKLHGKTLLNLNGMTNTELKLNYGIMNFEKLASYDTNFLDFVSIVPDYCIWLADSCDEKDKAIKLLKFAKECASDSKKIDALYEKLLNS